MSAHSIPVLVMAGITLYVGAYHLFLYLRLRRRRYDLTFALTCFVVFAYDLISIGLYNATTVADGVAWQRWQVVLLGVSGISLLYFLQDYTHRVSQRILWGISLYYALSSTFMLVDRSPLTWTDAQSIKVFELAGGYVMTYYEAVPGPLVLLQSAIGLSTFGYVFYVGFREYREGERGFGKPLIASMMLFFLGILNDTAVSSGIYQSIYLIEYSFMALILLMAYSLSNELMRAAQVEDALRISEARLVQAEKMESIGRLAGGVAHDLNNMLTPILGYAELAVRGVPEGSDAHECLMEIQAAAVDARNLTSELLAFSRKQVLERRVLDLNGLIADFESMLRRLIPATIEIRLELSARTATVRADPTQLRQIVMNLGANARDAMPSGGTLTLATRDVELAAENIGSNFDAQPGAFVELRVADTGTGIPAETVERIFEPFFTTKGPGQGTGLGLSTVHGIVSQHGGTIVVESTRETGTVFKINLPSVEAPVDDNERESRKKIASPRGDETILIAEDNARIRTLARGILEPLGYHVLLADSGEEALEILARSGAEPALLLTDVVMPGISGHELYEQARNRTPELRALFMSGYAEESIAASETGGLQYSLLKKPFSSSDLAHRIREVLDA